MAEIKFDYSALKKSDQELYDKLSATDRKSFETAWIEIEKEKVKLQQKKNRLTKVKNNQKEKERKERTRYLIQIGAILDTALGERFDTPLKLTALSEALNRRYDTPKGEKVRYIDMVIRDAHKRLAEAEAEENF